MKYTIPMADKKKMSFHTIPINSNRKEFNWKEKYSKEYIKNGEDNLFPNHLIEMYNRSSVHAACINAITQGIIGEGLTANEETYLTKANSKGQSWNDLFQMAALDYKLHGSFAFEVIYSKDRSRAEYYHIDYSYIRAAEKDHRGHVPGYYVCTEWDRKKRFSNSIKEGDDVMYLPNYNPEQRLEEPSQIYVHHAYRPGQEYYPLPDYVAALRVIELDTEVDNFHVSNIKNGLAPSLAITTFTNGSDDQVSTIEQQLRANYGGSDNAGALIYMDVADKEAKPEITPIPQNGADGYYSDVNDMVMQKLLTAHRITSPMILGIKTQGQLGGRDETVDAYLLFQNSVIIPYQQNILASLESLMSFNYPDIVLGVEQRKLYSDGEEEVEIVTDSETTDREQIDIEQPELLA